jgi:branched-chain amino acid transport system permease protein
MSLNLFLFQLANGVSFGALLFVLASGFTLIFGLLRIVNLAHGAFYLIGGYVALTTIRYTGNFWLAMLSAPLAIGVLGLFVERVLLRPIRGLVLPEVLLTVGLSFVLVDLSIAIWGGDPTSVPIPDFFRGPVDLGFTTMPRFRVFAIVLAVIVGAALFYVHTRTRIGAIVRAGVDDRETIAALGINVDRVFMGVFIAGAFLAGLSGVTGGAVLSLVPRVTDIELLLYSLVVVIIGGLGSLPGAVIGSLIVGLADSFGRSLLPEFAYFTLFAPMAIVLVFRPKGLLGRDL